MRNHDIIASSTNINLHSNDIVFKKMKGPPPTGKYLKFLFHREKLE